MKEIMSLDLTKLPAKVHAPGELEAMLCTRCGLCCNGSFFADVELSGTRESAPLEALGLEIEDDNLLIQPCGALKGTRCSIYAHRPKCCRTFECLLLQRVRAGEVSIPVALRKIAQARAGSSKAALEKLFLGL
jgi:uncharacterized protein